MDDFDPDPDNRCCGCAGLERVPSCAAVLKGKAARTAAGFRHGRQRLPCIPITFRSSVSQTVATPLNAPSACHSRLSPSLTVLHETHTVDVRAPPDPIHGSRSPSKRLVGHFPLESGSRRALVQMARCSKADAE